MMGFLSPTLLLLGAAIAVPLVLHLFQRQQGPRMIFPALRYLRRAEKENARRIKLRQILLMALRMAALILLALAAARPFLQRGGAGHEPTAVAIILDNSLSTGLIVGEERLLDQLKERALETLSAARPEDRFWLIRAGTPWEPAVPGDAREVAERVRETEVAATEADLGAALARARALVEAGAEGRGTEIHLLTDLQATAFDHARAASDGAPPVLVWAPTIEVPNNAAVTDVQVGGGMAPRAGERSSVSAFIHGAQSNDTIAVRLSVADRISAAATAPTGAAVVLPLPERPAGLTSGWVELDPDGLRGDDRRYFAIRVEEPPSVGTTTPLPFVDEALDVLADAGRLRRVPANSGDIVIAPAAIGAFAVRDGRIAVILAPSTTLELPAANRRLADAGIPWRFTATPDAGEARLALDEGGDELLSALGNARIHEAYRLERQTAAGRDSVLLRLRDGAPWIVRGELADGGRYLILASPLTAEASTLPTSTAMLPLLDRMIGAWAAAEPAQERATPGDLYPLPTGATAVQRPDGVRDLASPGVEYRVPSQPGIYRILADNQVIGGFAVNPPASESDLTRTDRSRLAAVLPGWSPRVVDDAKDWSSTVFRNRLGREVWRPLVLLAFAVLLIEALIAASGRATADGSRPDRFPGAVPPARVAHAGSANTPEARVS